MKPSVRRARTSTGELADGWTLTKPAYGFGAPTTRTYPTWRTAHNALRPTGATAGPLIERHVAGYVPGLHAGWGRSTRPRWIEA